MSTVGVPGMLFIAILFLIGIVIAVVVQSLSRKR